MQIIHKHLNTFMVASVAFISTFIYLTLFGEDSEKIQNHLFNDSVYENIIVVYNTLSVAISASLFAVYVKYYGISLSGFKLFIGSHDFFYPISIFIFYILACCTMKMYEVYGSPVDLLNRCINDFFQP